MWISPHLNRLVRYVPLHCPERESVCLESPFKRSCFCDSWSWTGHKHKQGRCSYERDLFFLFSLETCSSAFNAKTLVTKHKNAWKTFNYSDWICGYKLKNYIVLRQAFRRIHCPEEHDPTPSTKTTGPHRHLSSKILETVVDVRMKLSMTSSSKRSGILTEQKEIISSPAANFYPMNPASKKAKWLTGFRQTDPIWLLRPKLITHP